MKILHTADWHLGKRLHNMDMSLYHLKFIKWLLVYCEEERVDLIVIAGDIFDLAHPSLESQKIYYDFLNAAAARSIPVVISSGNHDSPSFLQAPSRVLEHLDVHISARWTGNPEDVLIPIEINGEQVVIAALPFLRDTDLRDGLDHTSYADRMELQRRGYTAILDSISQYCKIHWENLPAILMAHAHLSGSTTSDSERDLTIGTLNGVPVDSLGNYWDYVALGHIHKPQKVGGREDVLYSGSPLPLSFSERKDVKRIIVLDTNDSLKPLSVELPEFVRLKRIKGNLSHVMNALEKWKATETITETWLEVELIEEHYQETLRSDLENTINGFKHESIKIVNWSVTIEKSLSRIDHLFISGESLESLSPQDVFAKRLEEDEGLSDEDRQALIDSFAVLLEETSYSGDAN